MWITLAVYGIIIGMFGFFLMFLTGAFGFVIFILGPLMIIASIILKPPDPEKPDDITKKYCSYCMAEINKTYKICPICNQEVN